MEIWVLGGDARSRAAAQQLRLADCRVQTHGVPGMEDAPLPAHVQVAVLPCPAVSGDCLRGQRALPLESLLPLFNADSRVYGGLLGPWAARLRAQGAQVRDLWGTEPLRSVSAAATAEGAIALALRATPRLLPELPCLVIGFGRIGKLLALKLRALGATVTVAARQAGDRALAQALGLEATKTGEYAAGLARYALVFNTVPAPVLSPEQLRQLPPQCVLLELASAPGGFDREVCKALGLTTLYAPGLPGDWAPQSAGVCYVQSVLQLMRLEGVL